MIPIDCMWEWTKFHVLICNSIDIIWYCIYRFLWNWQINVKSNLSENLWFLTWKGWTCGRSKWWWGVIYRRRLLFFSRDACQQWMSLAHHRNVTICIILNEYSRFRRSCEDDNCFSGSSEYELSTDIFFYCFYHSSDAIASPFQCIVGRRRNDWGVKFFFEF